MEAPARKSSLAGPVAFAAIVSLAVVLLRLYGERNGWSPRFFNTEPGGGGAIVGISWLAPLFGIWFARRLLAGGRGPARKGRALLFALIGAALLIAPGPVVGNPESSIPAFGKIAMLNVSVVIGASFAFVGWKELGRTLVLYGYLARLPVVVVTWVAIQKNWGTHFEKGLPGLPEMEFLPRFLVTCVLPQFVTWICFTVITGSLFGALTALLQRKSEPAATAMPATPAAK